MKKRRGGGFYAPTPWYSTTTMTTNLPPLSHGGRSLERAVFALGLAVFGDLEEGLGLPVLLVGILLESDSQFHSHERADEVEELATLGEVILRAVGNLHTLSLIHI